MPKRYLDNTRLGHCRALRQVVKKKRGAQARLLEPWAMLWISLAFRGTVGWDLGFALLRRQK
jgi:hypothetical protein